MFKNPLKYQEGGSTQNAMQKLVAFLVQNTGLDENTISQKLQAILSDETAKAQLTTVLENMQNGNDQEATAKLISMFTQDQTEMKRKGGKIQSFICKHGRGGNVNCGCQKSQTGGKVEKHQDANGKIGVTKGQYQRSDWENESNQFTPTPGGGYARNYRLPIFGGHRWGIPGNTLRQILITYGDSGKPRKVVRDLKGYFGNGQIDTVIYDANGNTRNSPAFEARVNKELEGMDPGLRQVQQNQKGGKVEKAQEGSILDYYSNKWSNDLNRIKQGWSRFKESAPGKIWGIFMPNPNSEAGMLGAAAPVGKISSLGKAASKLDDEVKVLGYYDELGNFIKTEGDDVLQNVEKYRYNQKPSLPEYNKYDLDNLPEFKFEEPDYSSIDFNNLVTPHADLGDWIIGGGIAAGAGAAAGAAIHQNKKEKQESTKTNKKQNK